MTREQTIAHDLLSIGAVFLRPDEPFTWASGIKSPVYCDNRLTLTDVAVRTDETDMMAIQADLGTGPSRPLSLAIAMVLAAGIRKSSIRSALRVSRELN